jgi:gliding motility-associated-like protein
MKHLIQIFILFVLVILCQPKQLNAQTGISIFCPDFSTTYRDGWQKNNHAVFTSPNILTLTTSAPGLTGSAFWKQKVALPADFSFSFFFTFKITTAGGGVIPADGITFCIQQASNTAGSFGRGFGYGGIAGKSIAIEYDPFFNSADGDHTGDPNTHHMAFDYNGLLHDEKVYPYVNGLPYVNATLLDGDTPTSLSLNDGNLKYSWIDYNGATKTLEVRISNTASRPTATTLSIPGLDLASNFLNSDVYFGFTGATGSYYENHDIYSAYATNKFDPIVNPTLYKQGTAFITLSKSNDIDNCTTPTSTITLTATDQSNHPVTNTPLTISLDAGTASFSTNTVTTDINGQATFILKNVASTNVIIRVTDPADGAFGTVAVTGILNILPISGTTTVCSGAQTQLTGSGTPATSNPWISSNTAIATVVSNTGLVTGVLAGTSTITYTNSTGCSVTTLVTVNAAPTISGTTSVCFGAQTQLTGSGTPAASNAWTSSNTAIATVVSNTGLVTGVLAGTSTITYNNAAGCSVTALVTVNAVPTISGTTAACLGAQTQLTGSGTAATSNAWISSNTANATVVSNTGLVTGVLAGTSTITYTNSIGCSATAVVTVNAVPTISGTLAVYTSAQTQLTGSGTAATSNAWTSSNTATATVSNAGLVTGVLAGTSTITYTNSAGCSVNAVVTVTVSSVDTSLTVLDPQQVCTNGGIVRMQAGVASAYKWLKNGVVIPSATSSLYSALQTGIYCVVVTNSLGFSDTSRAVAVNLYPQPVVDFTINNATQCFTGNSFVFTNTSSISTGTNTYSWAFGDSDNATSIDATHNYAAARVYSVKLLASTNNGCIDSATKSITINALPTGSVQTPVTNNICSGSSLLLTATGGDSYQWRLNGNPISGANSATYEAFVPGVYTATLISSASCSAPASGSISLSLLSKPTAAFTYQNNCVNVPVLFSNASSRSQSGAVTYAWSFGNGSFSSQSTPSEQLYSTVGNYIAKLVIVSTACPLLSDTILKIIQIVAPEAGIRYPAINVIKNVPYLLQARDIGVNYSWLPLSGISDPHISNPSYNYSVGADYRINITNAAGCTTVDSLLIRAFDKTGVYVPKAFAPNYNGNNELLRPILVRISTINYFRVYSRWGQLMYQTKNIGEGWNGTFKGATQPIETYTWIFEGVDYNGIIIRETGKTTLLR